ncbi:MAG: exosortase/archaeosortase family protein [Planctomycetota bacterium]|nr:exosortase/archaeosortase family protein [Planctomycetota bacterium]
MAKRKRARSERRKRDLIRGVASDVAISNVDRPPLKQISFPDVLSTHKWSLLAFLGVLLYSYWPTLIWVEGNWRTEPDYSHGYLVPFLAGLLLWHRQDSFPGIDETASWAGISLIFFAIVMRVAGRLLYADFLDAWSMAPLLAGVIWFAFGKQVMLWCSPAIVFLLFMFPLPYRAESLLSWKLQGIATGFSTMLLRVFGQPAVAESHVIWVGDQRLMVEEACSGMRIFVGIAALAFFWAAMVKRSWIDRLVLVASIFPLAILVNAVRVTVVGLLYQQFGDASMRRTIHDWSGYLMIPLAFASLWLIKAYWERLYRPVDQLNASDFIRDTA